MIALWIALGWLGANAMKHLLAKGRIFVDLDLLPPVYSTWILLPGLPRWVRNTTDDPDDQRIYPRHVTRVGIEWQPLIFRLVIHYAYESKPGSGRLRTPKDTPQPAAVKEYAA